MIRDADHCTMLWRGREFSRRGVIRYSRGNADAAVYIARAPEKAKRGGQAKDISTVEGSVVVVVVVVWCRMGIIGIRTQYNLYTFYL